MKVTVNDILSGLGQIAPPALAESWDNVGLLIGDPSRISRSILLGVDPSQALLDEAIDCGADTLITHHPCIFHPLPSVHTNSPAGAFLEQALVKKINVIACHTNFDNAANGVSDALAAQLNLDRLQPIRQANSAENNGAGLGRIGHYPSPLSFAAFMEHLYKALALETVQIAGPPPQIVKTVALCGGSGSELAEEAFNRGADIYISAEIKHSTARWAGEAGFCVIDGTHYATERPAMELLANQLQSLAQQGGWDVTIRQTQSEKPAFTFIHKSDF